MMQVLKLHQIASQGANSLVQQLSDYQLFCKGENTLVQQVTEDQVEDGTCGSPTGILAWENGWFGLGEGFVWVDSGDTVFPYSFDGGSFTSPVSGWMYGGNYGGLSVSPRTIVPVGVSPSGISLEIDVYSPEVMNWSKSYTLVVEGALDSYTEQSIFDVPPVPLDVLGIGTHTFIVDISALGAIESVGLYYGGSEGSGDRSFIFTDIRVLP